LRTTLYVDGFNFYYGCAKRTRLKWVNLVTLAEAVLPGVQISKTRYFTAMVKSDPKNPNQNQRQAIYLRALRTLPNLTIHMGLFQSHDVWARQCLPPQDMVKIIKNEEKGSDVNLATYMLIDAFRDDCDQLVVITNDSDFAEPIRFINTEMKRRVIVLNPQSGDSAARKSARTGKTIRATPSSKLKGVAYSVHDIRSHGNDCHMSRSQFPDIVADPRSGRKISKPPEWV
jgi:hypothetical protein